MLLPLILIVVGAVGAVGCAAFATVLDEERVLAESPVRERANHPSEGAPLIRRRKEAAWELV